MTQDLHVQSILLSLPTVLHTFFVLVSCKSWMGRVILRTPSQQCMEDVLNCSIDGPDERKNLFHLCFYNSFSRRLRDDDCRKQESFTCLSSNFCVVTKVKLGRLPNVDSFTFATEKLSSSPARSLSSVTLVM